MKKGQAAMEFLMTYGWAILVVLAAIGALAYFGVLSPGNLLPAKCDVTPPFSCTEHKVYATGQVISMALVNTGGSDLTDVTVAATCKDRSAAAAGTDNGLTNEIVRNGDVYNGTPGGPVLNLTCADIGAAGSRYNIDFTITWTKSGESVSHTSTGTLRAKAE